MATLEREPGRSPQGPAGAASPIPLRPSVKPALAGPVEPPHPVLQAAGFNGGINAFNAKVQAIVDAHRHAYGDTPSPALTLDVARSDVPDHQYADLFSVPKNPNVARAQGVLNRHGISVNDPATHPTLANAFHQVQTRDQLNQLVTDNADVIAQAVADPASRAELETAFGGALARVRPSVPLAGKPSTEGQHLVEALDNVTHRDQLDAFFVRANAPILQRALSNPVDAQAFQTAFQSALDRVGVDPVSRHDLQLEMGYGGLLSRIVGMGALAGQQVATGLTLGPALLVRAEARGIIKSAETGSLDPFAHTNAQLAKGVAKGVVRDVEHPGANPGNFLLDILGLASLGAGSVARVAAAGRAFEAGGEAASLATRAGGVARALVTKPPTGTFHLGEGADVPLSGNPLVASIQKLVYTHRLNGLGLEESSGPVPASAAAAIADGKAASVADRLFDPLRANFSMENKIGRQLRAADRVQRAVYLSNLDPLALATGSAKSTSLVVRRLSPRGWRGLTIGEQKAIQVLTTDDPTPLQTWTAFHHQMIDEGVGDPVAHAAHLAALEQARKVIANPSPKFIDALQAVRDVSAEQTAIRIEQLGLTPETAEGRVARLGQIIRGEEVAPNAASLEAEIRKLEGLIAAKHVEERQAAVAPYSETAVTKKLDRLYAQLAEAKANPLRRVNPTESAYLLYQSLARNPSIWRRASTFFRPRPGPFGVPRPAELPELHHYFTGDAIRAGDFRIDATRLATETFQRTAAAAMRLSAWKRLHDHYATGEPRSEFDVPIRDARAVNDDLRALLAKTDNGQVLTAEDVHGLPPQMVDDLTRYLIPHPDDVSRADAAGKWKWVDERLLASEQRSARPSRMMLAFSALNEPLRDLTLFVRPAYLMNIFNSAQMAAIDQGFFAIPNLVRAVRAESMFGAKTARILDGMAGEGRMLSYAPRGTVANRVSHGLASQWNRVTDLYFRRAATLFYLRKAGYRTAEQIKQVTLASLHDADALKVVTEASQRAKKSMVELDNLTPFEKNALRHMIFVYPWVSRSAVWSLRTIAEHPAQSAIYAEIVNSDHEEIDKILSHLPAFMRDSGVIPVGYNNNGDPIVVNPGSVNTFATLGEMAGIAEGDQTFTDLLGPGADLVVRLALERDRFGRAYKHPYVDPFVETLTGLPQLATLHRAGQKEPATAPLDVTSETGLASQEHAEKKRPLYVPGGFWNTYGSLLLSGLAPRALDPKAVEARWWAGEPWPVRHQHEAQLAQRMAGVQGEFIGRKVPGAVRDALQLAADRTEAYHRLATDKGRTPTMVEKTELDIATLEAHARLSSKQADTLNARLKQTAPDELDSFRNGLLNRYAGGAALSDWHRQVALVARVANGQDLDGDIRTLVGAGVLPKTMSDAANAPDKTLLAYGREYLAYDAKIREFAQREKDARKAGDTTRALADELRAFVDEQDKPVTINGHVFPSLARLAVAHMSPAQLDAHLADNYSRSLATLSALDKSLMGLKSSAAVTRAWGVLDSTLAAARAQDPTRSDLTLHNARIATNVAGQIDRYYQLHGAFVNEVKLSLEPRWQVLQQTRIYTDSPNKPVWDALFTALKQESANLASPNTDHGAVRRQWDTYARTQLPEQIKQQSPAFWRELQPYLQANPSFLIDLISRG
jgi:hypothetical protein